MKTVLVFLVIAFQSFYALNQTHKNIGIICAYNFGQKNQLQPSLQLGLSKQFGKYLLPEIGIRIENKIPFNQVIAYTGSLQIRKSLFKLRVHNRGGICKAEVIECFVTPEYFYLKNGNSHHPQRRTQNQFSMRYGLCLYHLKSGGSRNSKSWVSKIEIYNRTIFTTKQNEMGIALRVQSFRKRGGKLLN